jgi:hypothetical protein
MNPPEFITVQSSLLTAVAYSTDAILELQFHRGAIYRYFAVPPEVFHGLLSADSKGLYFNRYVRNRFRYQRVA